MVGAGPREKVLWIEGVPEVSWRGCILKGRWVSYRIGGILAAAGSGGGSQHPGARVEGVEIRIQFWAQRAPP